MYNKWRKSQNIEFIMTAEPRLLLGYVQNPVYKDKGENKLCVTDTGL